MTSGIGPGVRRFRELLARGEEPDAGAIAREHPGETLAIADEVIRAGALYWARAREEMWLARAEVMRDAGEDITFGTVLRNAREDRGLTVPALAAAARERGADLARTTIERLEANQIAVTDIEPRSGRPCLTILRSSAMSSSRASGSRSSNARRACVHERGLQGRHP